MSRYKSLFFLLLLSVGGLTFAQEGSSSDATIIDKNVNEDESSETASKETKKKAKEEKPQKEVRIHPKKEPKALKIKGDVPLTKVLVDKRGKIITSENEREAVGKIKPIELIPSETVEVDERSGAAHVVKNPYFVHDWGLEYALVTRIQSDSIPKKGDFGSRSNFTWQDHLVGAFYQFKSKNFYVNFLGRLSVFYPFYHTFNGMENIPTQVILYAADLFTAPYVTFDCNYVRINLGLGLHAMYQLSDEFHLWYLGAGQQLGLELPVARHWTILLEGLFTFDNANLGGNQYVHPFDWSYQFHGSLGVRYSIKGTNKYPYGHKKRLITAEESAARQAKADEKAAAKEAKRAAALQKKQEKAAQKQAILAAQEAQKAALDAQFAQLEAQKAEIEKMLLDAKAAQDAAAKAQESALEGTKEAEDAKAQAEAAKKALEEAQAAMEAQKLAEEEAAKKSRGPKRSKKARLAPDGTEGDASKEEHLKR